MKNRQVSKLYFEFYTYLPNKSNEKFQNLQITLKIKSNLDTTQNFVENIIFRTKEENNFLTKICFVVNTKKSAVKNAL